MEDDPEEDINIILLILVLLFICLLFGGEYIANYREYLHGTNI